MKILMTANRWDIAAGVVNFVDYMGKPSIELKAGNFAQHIKSVAVTLKGLNFRNGIIDYDVASTGDMGAGFIFVKLTRI